MLEFLSDPRQQLEFATRVTYDNYSSEFYCWWFDDFVPDSELFQAAFTPSEILLLQRFSSRYKEIDLLLGERKRKIETLLACAEWQQICATALDALKALHANAT